MTEAHIHPLARYIDHTLLKPQTRGQEIERLCGEARRFGFYGVCVNGRWVPLCRELLAGSGVAISAVVGFPLGAAHPLVKALEAERAVRDGAGEIDMVISVGDLLDGQWRAVEDDIRGVCDAVRGSAIVKVILETGLLDDDQKRIACRLAAEAGAHFVKTSTGFGLGGATADDVRLMRSCVPPEMKVKASGGIRDAETARIMIEAGADRLGTSSGVAIVSGTAGTAAY
jgi:deoxyribose-phosphate aldolase